MRTNNRSTGSSFAFNPISHHLPTHLKMNGLFVNRWLIPILSACAFFAVILFFFPYNSGDTSLKSPLGWALWSIWTTTDPGSQDYSYCLLVPLMLAYIIFEKRLKIIQAPGQGTNRALAGILLGLLLFWIGARAGKQYVGCAGIQILLLSLVYWFWGGKVFRVLFFAWAIIGFAWPLPFLDTAVAFPLRMIVSHAAFFTLNLLGIPTVQSGTALFSASNPAAGLEQGARFQIDIADPCSGLHSLLPLLMFSAFYSYFFLRRPWQQWVVFLSAIPFTIAGNVVRILMLVMGSIAWGSAFAIGKNDAPSEYHEFCGFAVFIVVLGLECLFGFLLNTSQRYWSGPTAAGSEAGAPGRDIPSVQPATEATLLAAPVPVWRSGVVLSLAGVMVIICLISPPVYLPTEAGVLMSLPGQVVLPNIAGGHFSGFDAQVSEVEHRLLPKDTEFVRKTYDDFHFHEVYFSIVLSGVQQYTIHPPEVCLVAQGWTIFHQDDIPIRLASGHTLVARNLSIQRDAIGPDQSHHLLKAYYMYWYVADDFTTPSHTVRNLISSWDRVVHNRDHRWAYVIAMSPITNSIDANGLNADQTRDLLTDFIRQIVPTFQKNELRKNGDDS